MLQYSCRTNVLCSCKNQKLYSNLINVRKDDILITPPDKKLKGNSKNWRNHESKWLLTTCDVCKDVHGKIYELDIKRKEYIQHPFCQCEAPTMRTKSAGTATQKGTDGADFYLKYLKNYRLITLPKMKQRKMVG